MKFTYKDYKKLLTQTNVCVIIYVVIEMNKVYLCIDLKTFFASVECVERKLDPFKVDLIVCDPSRTKGAICLAISPKMKSRGIKNRCRIYDIPKFVKPIIAKPRMKKYIEYSSLIYGIYLKYIDKKDIHVYSIDEAFLDVTNYLNLYKKTPKELANMIMDDIFKTTGITSAAGIGTNLYLAKIALDITAKHSNDNIGYLDEEKYIKELSNHLPLSDFWQIGNKTESRLNKLHIRTMEDIRKADENILYKEFGINAKLLIDHSYGIEPCTINDIKRYKTKSNSISNNQILYRDYDYIDAKKVLIEMIDNIVLELVNKDLYTNGIAFYIGYSKHEIPSLKVSKKLDKETNSYKKILDIVLKEYDYRVSTIYKIRRIGVCLYNIGKRKYEQLDIFNTSNLEYKENKIEQTINDIKKKYGKNSILRCISLEEGATQIDRNKLIGGHNAE